MFDEFHLLTKLDELKTLMRFHQVSLRYR